MSFTFDFDLDDDLDEAFDAIPAAARPPLRTSQATSTPAASTELPLSDLLDTLPEVISYSPLTIPVSRRAHITLARRDLFDARYQLIAQDGAGASDRDALAFLDAPSDLVPGVYEGGLKTWECSLDLVDYLESVIGEDTGWVRGRNILELGCGTAVPSVYLLSKLFASELASDSDSPWTYVTLQDYNRSVLELVTLPNVVLAWYMSPLSLAFRSSDSEEAPNSDSLHPGELALPPTLLAAFNSSLIAHRIRLRFISGAWDTLNLASPLPDAADSRPPNAFDLVLTSETIYKPESLPPLLRVLRDATASPLARQPLCLVAAKLVYFGVGGGVEEFLRAVESSGGSVVNVWERREGIGRRVMQVLWSDIVS
ncbi:hypothetical protein FA95DRAFT_990366 [Auriscalpium vulgare]|uniref:Uncharacterized protein n=1 Tax=Auriscalpium vulgare TaxID=40419 RepID=A0ACB8R7J9_9AGAM|nr:hypothetical protein FA95DRAFT_990366 [Auriscalpium vulgare]